MPPCSGDAENIMATTASNGEAQVKGTAAFSKFMKVLQAIADSSEPADMAQLSASLPYPRATLYRIVSALVSEELVEEDKATGTFRLGIRLVNLAAKAWDENDLRLIAREHIVALRDATGETIHLAVPSGTEMVYIDKLESPRNVRMTSRIGTRVSLHSTSVGKAYLAALDLAACENIIASMSFQPRTEHTIVDRAVFEAELQKTRARGFSADYEENELEIGCFGAAILGRNGSPIGAISMSMPKYRFDKADVASYQDTLLSTVKAISHRLGASS